MLPRLPKEQGEPPSTAVRVQVATPGGMEGASVHSRITCEEDLNAQHGGSSSSGSIQHQTQNTSHQWMQFMLRGRVPLLKWRLLNRTSKGVSMGEFWVPPRLTETAANALAPLNCSSHRLPAPYNTRSLHMAVAAEGAPHVPAP
jgi:hypothetical protein